jgi:hypothetical protein
MVKNSKILFMVLLLPVLILLSHDIIPHHHANHHHNLADNDTHSEVGETHNHEIHHGSCNAQSHEPFGYEDQKHIDFCHFHVDDFTKNVSFEICVIVSETVLESPVCYTPYQSIPRYVIDIIRTFRRYNSLRAPPATSC